MMSCPPALQLPRICQTFTNRNGWAIPHIPVACLSGVPCGRTPVTGRCGTRGCGRGGSQLSCRLGAQVRAHCLDQCDAVIVPPKSHLCQTRPTSCIHQVAFKQVSSQMLEEQCRTISNSAGAGHITRDWCQSRPCNT